MDENNPKDSNGHGTWVAGVIGANGKFLGIAPECELYVAKVLGDDGVGSYKWLCDALVWGLEEDVDIVNLSLGGDFKTSSLHIDMPFYAFHKVFGYPFLIFS